MVEMFTALAMNFEKESLKRFMSEYVTQKNCLSMMGLKSILRNRLWQNDNTLSNRTLNSIPKQVK